MRGLNLLVALHDYEENAAPDLLLNPYTLELDRYYPTHRQHPGDPHV